MSSIISDFRILAAPGSEARPDREGRALEVGASSVDPANLRDRFRFRGVDRIRLQAIRAFFGCDY